MLSLIEVKCPHCGAHGQIMLPPLGAIIVGPCPECKGMVVVFCGRVLPLDKDIMDTGLLEEKKSHLMAVLNEFLDERLDKLFAEQEIQKAKDEQEQEQALEAGLLEGVADAVPEPALQAPNLRPANAGGKKPISETEMTDFVNVDLKLLDNKDYFKAVFE